MRRSSSMKIVCTVVLVLCLGILGSAAAMGQEGGATAPTASQAGQPDQAQQAYHLPPEKLAKAIALNRIRNVEHFVDAFWGLLVLWLLLSLGLAAGMEAWAKQVSGKRWIQ